MPLQPRDSDEIYEQIRADLEDNIVEITNFVDGSFNDQMLVSYAEQVRESEIKALAGELAGLVDFAGKELTEDDLDRLGIAGVDPADINEYQQEEHLENLAGNFSIERDPGKKATGTVVIEVSDTTVEIQEGFEVATSPGPNTESLVYQCDVDDDGVIDDDSTATVSASSADEDIEVDVIATEPGTEYNVGADNIVHFPNPQPGVQAVTNPVGLENGEDEQELEELREDVQNALFQSSEGGTKAGVKAYVERNSSDDVTSTEIIEFTDERPPFVEVVVDGGDRSTIEDLIDEKKPVGIRHDLVRPTAVSVGTLTEIVGTGTDVGTVAQYIDDQFDGLEIGEYSRKSRLVSRLSGIDSEIVSVPEMNNYYEMVTNERRTFEAGTDTYELDFGPLGVVDGEEHYVDSTTEAFWPYYTAINEESLAISVVEDGSRRWLADDEFSVSTDYSNITPPPGNADYDNDRPFIDLASNVVPDRGTTVELNYTHRSYTFESVTANGTTYTEGIDYAVTATTGSMPDAIQWKDDGSSPDGGERFTMSYAPRQSAGGDIIIDKDEMLHAPAAGKTRIEVYDQ